MIWSQPVLCLVWQSPTVASSCTGLRIPSTMLLQPTTFNARLHLATCALSSHLDLGILKCGKAPVFWLPGMSVCFPCHPECLGLLGDTRRFPWLLPGCAGTSSLQPLWSILEYIFDSSCSWGCHGYLTALA